MKTDTLKFKAVMFAIALAGMNYMPAHASTSTIVYTQAQSDFIEHMFIEIRDAVDKTIDLIDSFVDKANKESFTAFMNKCADQIQYIEKNILAVLEAELKIAQATQPNSEYTKALEKTYKFGKEKAYKELVDFYEILDKHRKDPKNAKNALELVNKLKPHLNRLISTPTLDMLDRSLTDINQHLDSTGSIAKEIKDLQKLVKDLRVKAAAMQGKVNAGLLPVIQARLQRL